jgi:hypothetical protein
MSKLLLIILSACLFGSIPVHADPQRMPLEVVNLRMKYYNEHRIDDMLALYAENIEIYTYPDRLLGRGKDHLRKVFEEVLSDASVRVAISKQIAKDGFVINEEVVSYQDKPTRYVSIYEVRSSLITSVRFVRD